MRLVAGSNDAAMLEFDAFNIPSLVSGIVRPADGARPASGGNGPADTSAPQADEAVVLDISEAARARVGESQGAGNDPSQGSEGEEGAEDAAASAGPRGTDGEPLSEEEQQEVKELEARDREVRAHEQAHKAAGGQYAGSPSYDYETGPDGKQYATSGEVKIDTAAIPNDPQATIEKMETVKRAALAPAEPSSADRQVAAKAEQAIQQARRELAEERIEGKGDEASEGSSDPLQANQPGEPGQPGLVSADNARADDAYRALSLVAGANTDGPRLSISA